MRNANMPSPPPPRPTPIDRLYTIYAYTCLWSGVLVYLVLLGPVVMLAGATFDKTRTLARRSARHLFTIIVGHLRWIRRVPVAVDAAPFDWKSVGPCIVVANHGSAMDSVLLMFLPAGVGDGRVWSKGWPFKVPLLGSLMRLSGHLFVEDFNILPDAQSCLGDGTSLLVFPESSRTRTGKLGRFRDGAFLLSVRSGRPIVPIAIHGAHECFPPGQPWMFGPPLRVEPLGVLWPRGSDLKAHATLKREAHRMISEALHERSQKLSPAAADAA
jgi:1-acyl-sn-glycerol-3-phosphate acyltransferase